MPRPSARPVRNALDRSVRMGALGTWAFAALCALAAACAHPEAETPPTADAASLRTPPAGPVRGFVDRYGAHAWWGLPYAAPPTDALRWRPPRPAEPWTETRDALDHGPVCPQFASPLGGVADVEPGTLVGDEDCLTLDVYAPRLDPDAVANARLPVMLWIHGGGNTIGTARFYEGGRLAAEQDVVVVMVNYRLGPFGWFRHPALAGAGAGPLDRSGNWATLDLIRALGWVRENAAAFGGDPGNVTIFGESAGGTNVITLLASPPARGLFQRAIVQSGGTRAVTRAEATHPVDAPEPGLPQSASEVLYALLVADGQAEDRDAARALADGWDAEAIADFLRGRSTAQVMGAYAGGGALGMFEMPKVILDGAVLPEQGLAETLVAGRGAPVPVMFGTNRDEMKLFLFVDPQHVRRWFGVLPQVRDETAYMREAEYRSLLWKATGVDELAGPLAARRPGEVFAYRFDWDEEPRILWADLGELVGAAHGFEIPFVFGHWNLGREGRVLFSDANQPGREALSEAMRGYWAAFARRGDPGRGGREDATRWQAWDASTPGAPKFLVLDTPQDGGARMASETVSVDGLVARILEDPRFETAEARCAMLKRVADSSWRFDAADVAARSDGACEPPAVATTAAHPDRALPVSARTE